MLGAFFILDDPIFNGLAISLIFGILVSTLLTLVVIPVLYYAAMKRKVAEKHAPWAARTAGAACVTDARTDAGHGRACMIHYYHSFRRATMTTERLVRIFAGAFVLISLALGVSGSPILRQQLLAVVHRLRRRQPVPERVHHLLPAGEDPAQARREESAAGQLLMTWRA